MDTETEAQADSLGTRSQRLQRLPWGAKKREAQVDPPSDSPQSLERTPYQVKKRVTNVYLSTRGTSLTDEKRATIMPPLIMYNGTTFHVHKAILPSRSAFKRKHRSPRPVQVKKVVSINKADRLVRHEITTQALS